MNKRAILAATAMLATSLNPILTTAAWADTVPTPTADTADQTTLDAMQSQCDALAAAHDVDGIGTGDIWSGVVVAGAVTLVSGPTEVGGTRVIDQSTVQGSGSFTYGGVSIAGDPYRIGGSVNMFGDQRATEKNWTNSTYNFTADFDSTFAHAFSCNIFQEVYHPAVDIPGHPVEGYYVVHVDEHGNEEGTQNSCDAFTAQAPQPPLYAAPPWWGYVDPDPTAADQGQCDFNKTADAVESEHQDEYWDPAALVGNEAGTPVNQDQTDSLTAFEDQGGPVTETGDFFVGQTVVCISPTTGTQVKKGVPGTWVAKNGYTGVKCTTAWFNVAPWGGGSQDSNGTYISVPAI